MRSVGYPVVDWQELCVVQLVEADDDVTRRVPWRPIYVVHECDRHSPCGFDTICFDYVRVAQPDVDPMRVTPMGRNA